MASLQIETFRSPADAREARALDSARKRIAADLAGRTVWCAGPVREGRASARRLRGHLEWAGGDGVTAAWLRVVPGAPAAEDLFADVRPDDVVVLLDPVTAAPAEAIRERGAHALWQVTRPQAPVAGVDAYVVASLTPDGAQFIAALMPGAGVVAAKELRGGASCRAVGWSSLLADVVRRHHDECVGGTLHARPTVHLR